MAIRIIIPPRPYVVPEVMRCSICAVPYGEDGVPVCSFLHGRVVVTVIGGNE